MGKGTEEATEDNENGYYGVLDVALDATEKQIKKAYRNLARRHHPDKNPNDKEGAEERFKVIQEAYEHLGSPVKRARYNVKFNVYAKMSERRKQERDQARAKEAAAAAESMAAAAENHAVPESQESSSSSSSAPPRHSARSADTCDDTVGADSFSAQYTAYTRAKRASGATAMNVDDFKRYRDREAERAKMSSQFDSFAANVDKVQSKWRDLHRAKMRAADMKHAADVKKENMKSSANKPTDEGDEGDRSGPPTAATNEQQNGRWRPGNNNKNSSSRSRSSNRFIPDPKEAPPKADTPMESYDRMQKHIRLLEKLKKDQRKVVEKQMDMTWQRQRFWKKYNAKAEIMKEGKAEVQKEYATQAAKWEDRHAKFTEAKNRQHEAKPVRKSWKNPEERPRTYGASGPIKAVAGGRFSSTGKFKENSSSSFRSTNTNPTFSASSFRGAERRAERGRERAARSSSRPHDVHERTGYLTSKWRNGRYV